VSNLLFAHGLAMPEGPVALSDGSIALVEMGQSRKSVTIVRPDGTTRTVCRHGGNPNGLAMDGNGSFWVAGGPGQSLIRVDADGKIIARVDQDGQRPFLFPNDVAFGPDGFVYMTDSGIAPEAMTGLAEQELARLDYDGSVYRIDPRTCRVVQKIAGGLKFANGLAFSPTGDLLFNETLTGLVYRLIPDGRFEPFANVVAAPSGAVKGPDGMAFAADGTLYCAVLNEGHVCVMDCDGTVIDRLSTNGLLPTNLAFDPNGDRIYVTEIEGGAIEIISAGRAGLPLHRPQIDES